MGTKCESHEKETEESGISLHVRESSKLAKAREHWSVYPPEARASIMELGIRLWEQGATEPFDFMDAFQEWLEESLDVDQARAVPDSLARVLYDEVNAISKTNPKPLSLSPNPSQGWQADMEMGNFIRIGSAIGLAEEALPGLKMRQQGRKITATSLPNSWTRADLDSLMNVTLKLETGFSGRVYFRIAMTKDEQSELQLDDPAT